MIAAFDVSYSDKKACAAAVTFDRFDASEPTAEYSASFPVQSDYIPGEFYRRELPPIVALIEKYDIRPDIVVIDGYVFLDGIEKPGLGARLYEYLHAKVPVIGVAKNRFKDLPEGFAVYRKGSIKPLYVTSVGIDLERAKQAVISMHGNHRIPAMLKRVDLLSRSCFRTSE